MCAVWCATFIAACPAPDGAPDAGVVDVDAGTNFDFCHDLSIEECDVVGCQRMHAWPNDDYCAQNDVVPQAVACEPVSENGCGEAITCAVRPDDGERFAFPNTCTPRGWALCEYCDGFEFCETEASEFDVCVEEAPAKDACDVFLAVYDERWRTIVDASNTCANDFDCTTDVVSFLCGTGEVFVQGCSVPVAHDLSCEYRQAIQDLEVELCTAQCIPDDCGFVAACAPELAVGCVDGRCAFIE